MPIAVLEPVKPVGLYLAATGRVATGTLVLALGELLKIVIVERLFHVAKPKLMTIPAVAAALTFVAGWLAWLEALPPWRLAARIAARARAIVHSVWRQVTARPPVG